MLEKKLKQLMTEKAGILDLKYDKVQVVPINLDVEQTSLSYDNAEVFVELNNGTIFLQCSNLSKVPDDELEVMVEHLACLCKDEQEGFHCVNVFAMGSEIAKGMCLELYQSYTDYFACKRQIGAFGKEHFDKYQIRGLQSFADRVDKEVNSDKHHWQKFLYIAGMIKEQIKCGMMEKNPRIIPKVISKITAPLPESFERINKSGLSWVDKSKIMFMVSTYLGRNIDLVNSYETSRLVVAKNAVPNVSPGFLESGIFDGKTFKAAKGIEDYIHKTYQELKN